MKYYAILLWLMLVGRGLDLMSTSMVSPKLERELNPLIRWLGWRWTIAANIAFSLALPLAGTGPVLVAFTLSLLATAWNLRQKP